MRKTKKKEKEKLVDNVCVLFPFSSSFFFNIKIIEYNDRKKEIVQRPFTRGLAIIAMIDQSFDY